MLCGLLAEEERLRVYAAVALGAGTPSEVVETSGLPARDVVIALRRLEQGGLVSLVDGRLVADTGAFKDAVREHSPEAAEEPLDPDRQRAAVLRAFVRNGRLVPERAVDAVLRAWYDDYVTIRRYLIDEDLLARENGLYWRTGGYVDV